MVRSLVPARMGLGARVARRTPSSPRSGLGPGAWRRARVIPSFDDREPSPSVFGFGQFGEYLSSSRKQRRLQDGRLSRREPGQPPEFFVRRLPSVEHPFGPQYLQSGQFEYGPEQRTPRIVLVVELFALLFVAFLLGPFGRWRRFARRWRRNHGFEFAGTLAGGNQV